MKTLLFALLLSSSFLLAQDSAGMRKKQNRSLARIVFFLVSSCPYSEAHHPRLCRQVAVCWVSCLSQ